MTNRARNARRGLNSINRQVAGVFAAVGAAIVLGIGLAARLIFPPSSSVIRSPEPSPTPSPFAQVIQPLNQSPAVKQLSGSDQSGSARAIGQNTPGNSGNAAQSGTTPSGATPVNGTKVANNQASGNSNGSTNGSTNGSNGSGNSSNGSNNGSHQSPISPLW